MNEKRPTLNETFTQFDLHFPELAGIHRRVTRCGGLNNVAALGEEAISALNCMPRVDAQDCLITMTHVAFMVAAKGIAALCGGPKRAHPRVREVVDLHTNFMVYISTAVIPDAGACVCHDHSLERAKARAGRRQAMN